MSAISSFSPAANLYQAADRNSLAQSTDAVAGTEQAFAENDQETPHEGYRQDGDSEAAVPEMAARGTTETFATRNHRYVLNVTA